MTFNVLADRYDEIQVGQLQQNINQAISNSVPEQQEARPYSAGSGIDITNNVISFHFDDISNTDLDDVKYQFIGYSNSSTNQPSGANADGVLISVFRDDKARGMQMYSPHGSSGTLYLRKYYSGSWQSWTAV